MRSQLHLIREAVTVLTMLLPFRAETQGSRVRQESAAAYCRARAKATSVSDAVDILNSLNTSKAVAQPAFAQYTKTQGGNGTGAVGAAVKWQAYVTPCRSIGPFAEYLWNNATDKRQNTLRLGLDADWQVRALGNNFYSHGPLLLGQVNYRSDREKHLESVQTVVQLTWISPNQSWPAPNTTWRVGSAFDIVWAPLVGVVYDQVLQARDAGATGSIVRLAPQTDLVIYPLGPLLDRRLEFGFSYLLQYDTIDRTSEDDNQHERRRWSASFFPIRDDNVAAGLSVSRTSGEDPTKGYLDDRFWQLGITLRVR